MKKTIISTVIVLAILFVLAGIVNAGCGAGKGSQWSTIGTLSDKAYAQCTGYSGCNNIAKYNNRLYAKVMLWDKNNNYKDSGRVEKDNTSLAKATVSCAGGTGKWYQGEYEAHCHRCGDNYDWRVSGVIGF